MAYLNLCHAQLPDSHVPPDHDTVATSRGVCVTLREQTAIMSVQQLTFSFLWNLARDSRPHENRRAQRATCFLPNNFSSSDASNDIMIPPLIWLFYFHDQLSLSLTLLKGVAFCFGEQAQST
jgi:hypothetical protein